MRGKNGIGSWKHIQKGLFEAGYLIVLLFGEQKGALLVADKRDDIILRMKTRHKRLRETKQRIDNTIYLYHIDCYTKNYSM